VVITLPTRIDGCHKYAAKRNHLVYAVVMLSIPIPIWMAPLIALMVFVPTKKKCSLACMDVARWKPILIMMVLPIAMIVAQETRTGLAQNYVAVVSGRMIRMLMVHPDCTDKCAFN